MLTDDIILNQILINQLGKNNSKILNKELYREKKMNLLCNFRKR